MSPETITKLFYVVAFLQFIVPARDVLISKKTGIPWYKKISLAGWVLIFTGIASGVLTYFKEESDKKRHALMGVSTGPFYLDRVSDSIPIVIETKNFGQANARNIESEVVSVLQRGTFFYNVKPKTIKLGSSFFVAPGAPYSWYLQWKIDPVDSGAQPYLFLKVLYSDDDGQPAKDTIRQIYRLPLPKRGNPIFDAHDQEFESIRAVMVQSGLW
jgi:hypothetical protein